jgi:hypothetical protein
MMNFFEHCADIASVGIIVDFTEDTETYIVGSPADIKAWHTTAVPEKFRKDLCGTATNLAILSRI